MGLPCAAGSPTTPQAVRLPGLLCMGAVPSARAVPAAYAALADRFRRIGLLGGVESLLSWDTATMMPDGGAEARAEQQAAVASVVHRDLCDPAVGPLLDRAAGERLDAGQESNLRLMRHEWAHATAVPERLVEEVHRATAACEMAWREARPADDFAGLRPKLETVVRLVRERAAAKADALGVAPYQALLDEHNPGVLWADIDGVFEVIETHVAPLVPLAMERQARGLEPLPLPHVAPDAQRRLGRRLMQMLGFDFAHGRLDESRHPFMSGTPEDVRITMRTATNDFVSGMQAVAHETGHALYERGLPDAWRWQPAGRAVGMAVHEAQALLWEMQVVRGRVFLNRFAAVAREAAGLDHPALSADNLIRLVQRVQPGMIRVDADEVTYPLHVLLRYRLELALFDGRLEVADLPDAWGDGMERLLGIRPRHHGEGCLQDIHWTLGSFGYFPSYALGVTAAAQMFHAAEASDPALGLSLTVGDYSPLLRWLRMHVHRHGSLYSTQDLLVRATGRSFDAAALVAHLRARYVEERT